MGFAEGVRPPTWVLELSGFGVSGVGFRVYGFGV